MFYQILLFVFQIPKVVSMQYSQEIIIVFASKSEKEKKHNWKIEKVNVLLINMTLNRWEYKMQFLERGNYIRF